MENTKYGKRREGRWTPIRAKAQDTRANPNSWETHLARKRWDIGLLRALSLRIMMMMMTMMNTKIKNIHSLFSFPGTGYRCVPSQKALMVMAHVCWCYPAPRRAFEIIVPPLITM